MNLNIWQFFNQGNFGTEVETFSSLFLVTEKVQRACYTMFSRQGSCIQVLLRKVQYFACDRRSEGNG
jgi:hypothetical protein